MAIVSAEAIATSCISKRSARGTSSNSSIRCTMTILSTGSARGRGGRIGRTKAGIKAGRGIQLATGTGIGTISTRTGGTSPGADPNPEIGKTKMQTEIQIEIEIQREIEIEIEIEIDR